MGVAALLYIVNAVLFLAVGNDSDSSFLLVMVAFLAYWILRRRAVSGGAEEGPE
jgi:hypothetical protein